MYKFEVHCHTTASDGRVTPTYVVKKLASMGFDGVVITDHDTVDGLKEGQKAAKKYGLIFVPGIEITTPICDILGIGINKVLEGHPKDVIREIHKLGGVAVLPHPAVDDYSEEFKERLKIIKLFDAIEIVNGHVSAEKNIKALEIAEKYGLPKTAGSDSHFENDIGAVYTLSKYKNIIKAIKENKIGIGWM